MNNDYLGVWKDHLHFICYLTHIPLVDSDSRSPGPKVTTHSFCVHDVVNIIEIHNPFPKAQQVAAGQVTSVSSTPKTCQRAEQPPSLLYLTTAELGTREFTFHDCTGNYHYQGLMNNIL